MGRGAPDRVRAEVERLLAAGVAGGVFPGASAAIAWVDADGVGQRIQAQTGTLGGPQPRPVGPDSRYDLAELTQTVVATAACVRATAGHLDLDVALDVLLGDVRGSALAGVTLRQLLGHRGGLEPSGGLYLDVPHALGSPAARRWIVAEAARRGRGKTTAEPSDLGYLVAGEALSRGARRPLDALVNEAVSKPLGIASALLYPGALPTDQRVTHTRRSAYTERCAWRGEWIVGAAVDENAAALGGIAGHAGLFATAGAMASFGRACLDARLGRTSVLPAKAMTEALADLGDGSPLRLGWELAAPGGAGGKHLGAGAFGATGTSGTSIHCAPSADAVLVLLSNRICPSRANERIDGFRPAFHDGVISALR